jgi:hypothetical protein
LRRAILASSLAGISITQPAPVDHRALRRQLKPARPDPQGDLATIGAKPDNASVWRVPAAGSRLREHQLPSDPVNVVIALETPSR